MRPPLARKSCAVATAKVLPAAVSAKPLLLLPVMASTPARAPTGLKAWNCPVRGAPKMASVVWAAPAVTPRRASIPVRGFELSQTSLPGMSVALPFTKAVRSVISCAVSAVVALLETTRTEFERSSLVAIRATQLEIVVQLTPSAPSRLPLLLAKLAPGLRFPPNSTTRRRSRWVWPTNRRPERSFTRPERSPSVLPVELSAPIQRTLPLPELPSLMRNSMRAGPIEAGLELISDSDSRT